MSGTTSPPSSPSGPSSSKSPNAAAAAAPAGAVPIPFRPRKKLFIILLLVMAVWIGCLLAMYFITVRPYEHRAPQPQERDQLPPTAH